MAKSARRPQRIFSVVMWILSVIFAGFLIGLGSTVIRDLPKVDREITVEQFIDQDALSAASLAERSAEKNLIPLRRNLEDATQSRNAAVNDYVAARDSFDNWLATRTATQSDAQNPEVIRRTRNVEALRDKQRDALRAVEDAKAAQTEAQRALSDARSARSDLTAEARPLYRKALRGQELRVFLMRLALTLPLLLIAAWMVAKKRGSPYWPLYRGFILFALFAFFVELVPYLPSYGGYVRYAVGILIVVAAGHFIIRGMRQYMARKQAEEARSEGERRQSIEYETALKKLAAKSCPGCDRAIIEKEGEKVDFCVHCGIRLRENCKSCGHHNISFHRFCPTCGTTSESAPGRDADPQAPIGPASVL